MDATLRDVMLSDLRSLTSDAYLQVEITYTAASSVSYDPSSGPTRTESESEVDALRREVTTDEVLAGSGVEAGDRLYLLELDTDPTTSDRITDGSETWEVKSWEADPLGISYSVLARRIG